MYVLMCMFLFLLLVCQSLHLSSFLQLSDSCHVACMFCENPCSKNVLLFTLLRTERKDGVARHTGAYLLS